MSEESAVRRRAETWWLVIAFGFVLFVSALVRKRKPEPPLDEDLEDGWRQDQGISLWIDRPNVRVKVSP
jgi:hypothetical protein